MGTSKYVLPIVLLTSETWFERWGMPIPITICGRKKIFVSIGYSLSFVSWHHEHTPTLGKEHPNPTRASALHKVQLWLKKNSSTINEMNGKNCEQDPLSSQADHFKQNDATFKRFFLCMNEMLSSRTSKGLIFGKKETTELQTQTFIQKFWVQLFNQTLCTPILPFKCNDKCFCLHANHLSPLFAFGQQTNKKLVFAFLFFMCKFALSVNHQAQLIAKLTTIWHCNGNKVWELQVWQTISQVLHSICTDFFCLFGKCKRHPKFHFVLWDQVWVLSCILKCQYSGINLFFFIKFCLLNTSLFAQKHFHSVWFNFSKMAGQFFSLVFTNALWNIFRNILNGWIKAIFETNQMPIGQNGYHMIAFVLQMLFQTIISHNQLIWVTKDPN